MDKVSARGYRCSHSSNDLPPPYQPPSVSFINIAPPSTHCFHLSSLDQRPTSTEELIPWPSTTDPCHPPPEYIEEPPPYSFTDPQSDPHNGTSLDSLPVEPARQHEAPVFSAGPLSIQRFKNSFCYYLIFTIISLIVFPPIGLLALIYFIKGLISECRGDHISTHKHLLRTCTYNVYALFVSFVILLLLAIILPQILKNISRNSSSHRYWSA